MTVDTLDRFTMPEHGGGERRERRARRQSRRRHTRKLAAVVLVVAVIAAAVVVWVLQDSPSTGPSELLPVQVEEPGTPAPDTESPSSPSPATAGETPRGLLVEQAADGRIVGVTVLSVDTSGKGGHVVFLPAGAMVEVPSFGIDALRDAFSLGGLPLLQSSVENLLGLSFDAVSVAGPTQLAAALGPAGVLTVDVPARVEAVSPEGRVSVLWDQGPVAVSPADVPALLEAPGQGSDLDRLVRHQRFWEAWLGKVGEIGDDGLPPRQSMGAVGPLLGALAAGDVAFEVLPVEAVASGLAEENDLWSVRTDELAALVARVAPDATPAAARIRVQVLNGTGDVGVAQVVQPLLVPAGASVSLTGNADRFDYPVTQIVFYDDEDRASADAVRAALGVGEVVKSLTPLSVVDVTVVVGADLLQRQGA
jgi:hypothetical protein